MSLLDSCHDESLVDGGIVQFASIEKDLRRKILAAFFPAGRSLCVESKAIHQNGELLPITHEKAKFQGNLDHGPIMHHAMATLPGRKALEDPYTIRENVEHRGSSILEAKNQLSKLPSDSPLQSAVGQGRNPPSIYTRILPSLLLDLLHHSDYCLPLRTLHPPSYHQTHHR